MIIRWSGNLTHIYFNSCLAGTIVCSLFYIHQPGRSFYSVNQNMSLYWLKSSHGVPPHSQ